jgi:hypothetical protein
MKWLLVLTMALLLMTGALTASAADVAGTWKASVETPNGTFESTFVFKVDGAKLSGTVTGPMGEAAISDGKLEEDAVSFSIVRSRDGQEFKLTYKGKVKGNEMMLTLTVPGMDQTFDMTAKKVS